MIKKMPTREFVYGLGAAYERKDGYIMASTGQDPKKWAENSWWFTQYSGKQRTKALYWRAHAKRVWDCNGMAEGLYKDFSGKDINTKARYNYANWCETKGSGMIPKKYRVPGAAVFWGDTASTIHHVAYLYKPVDANDPSGDWWLIEARGVMYGVVKTKLSQRKPNYWGWMEKYFDYSEVEEPKVELPKFQLGDRALKPGMTGEDIKLLQEALNKIGYSLAVDGIFGADTTNAIMAFKKAYDIKTASGEVNSTYGSRAHTQLMKILGDDEPEPAVNDELPKKSVLVYAPGTWNVRKGPGTSYEIVTIVKDGTSLPYVSAADNGWIQVEINGAYGWLSPKCAELTR